MNVPAPHDAHRSVTRKRGARAVVMLAAIGSLSLVGLSADAAPTAPVVDTAEALVFVAVTPTRVLDTRVPIGVPTVEKFHARETKTLKLTGTTLVPAEAVSVAVNTTLDVDSTRPTFITVWPTGEARPNASANNTRPGMVSSNSTIAKVGVNGSVDIYNLDGDVHVIFDVVGYYLPMNAVAGDPSSLPSAITLIGTGAPPNSLGVDGNGYLDYADLEMYGPKQGGTWGAPKQLVNGSLPGFRVGVGAPASTLGEVGDSYMDQTNQDVYGPKSAGGWGLPVNLHGATGQTGAPGANGATILTGDVAPGSGVGAPGDVYVDRVAGLLYGPKVGTDWGTPTSLRGADGTNGTNGATILSGTGAPDPGDGNDGDIYIDTEGGELYGPKTGGVWALLTVLDRAPTASTDSALSASNTQALIALSLTSGAAVPFETTGVVVGGAVQKEADNTTFTFNTAGVYKVTYRLQTASLSLLGRTDVEVDSVAVDTGFALLSAGTQLGSEVLVQAAVGSELQIVTRGLGLSLATGKDATIVIELIATT